MATVFGQCDLHGVCTRMLTSEGIKKDVAEVATLLRCLVELRLARRQILNTALMRKWATTLETETVTPVLQDELYHVYRELGTMARAKKFASDEIGIVHTILKICGRYDDIEKLWSSDQTGDET